ncbi:carbohydrate binding domain-containing protein [Rhizobium sp. NFR12]|uniref:carbohydrate binding domain-containing protein n=1 Tax=Rhizobium sp. NFR12 TaxID=1566261 RepID=UPI0008A80749|nr:carbohydrate binding domain-containing protein [Rhizobium sp. NFR12]SEH22521.1 Carbohydrate binding domain-containing protein [Rhizobium sp. NFR12]
MIRSAFLALALFLILGTSADAGPVAGAVAAIGGLISGAGAVAGLVKIGLVVAANFGMSLIQQARARRAARKNQRSAGVTLSVQVGDTVPRSYLIGTRATAGIRRYIGTWGRASKTPNAYLTDVLEISCLPSHAGPKGLDAVWIGDKKVTVLWDEPHEDGLGYPVGEYRKDGKDYLWIKYLDGTQTVADPFLVATFSGGDRPFKSTMIGRGCQVVILTARINEDLFKSGQPQGLYQPKPMRLYDLRKDSTNGGVGTHRWSEPTTWESSDNLGVMSYNIARGIYYGGRWLHGGRNFAQHRLPASSWIAALNEADRQVNGRRQFRGGLEVYVDQDGLDVIEDLRLGCAGRVAEVGGILKMLIGAPAAAVYSFTDAELVITRDQDFEPFPTISATHNTITATYPEPAQRWAEKDAPERSSPALLTRDAGERLPITFQFDAVSIADQVQCLMSTMIDEEQRWRTHELVLPPDASPLEPNDVTAWSSVRNGYANKKFVVERAVALPGLLQKVLLKELDPTDYDPPEFTFPPVTGPSGPINPPVQATFGFNAQPAELVDGEGGSRRPSIKVSCAADQDDVARLWVQVRLKASGQKVYDADETRYGDPFEWILNAIFLPFTIYQVRGKFVPISKRETAWSDWIDVLTPNIRLTGYDFLNESITAEKIANAAVTADKIMNEAITALKLADKAVSTAKLSVGAVTAEVLASQAVIADKLANGAITVAKFAAGIQPVSIATGSALPITKTTDVITFGGKLYRWDGTKYTASVGNADILAGAIDATKFANGLEPVTIVSGSTLPVAKTTTNIVFQGSLYTWDGSKYSKPDFGIADGSVTAAKIADAAITAIKLASGAVTNEKLSANSIYGNVIAANAITARELVLTDFTNLFNDYDLTATATWTGNIDRMTVTGTADANGGTNEIRFSPAAADDTLTVYSNWTPCEPGAEYWGEVALRTGTDTTADVRIQWGSVSAAGAVAALAGAPTIASKTNSSANGRVGASLTAPADARRFRFVFRRSGTGSGVAVFSGPLLKRKNNANLIVDGAITALQLAANAVTADKILANSVTTAALAAGAVTAEQIAANAITAKQLLLVDFSNLVVNGDFSQGLDGWNANAGYSVRAETAVGGVVDRYAQISPTTTGTFSLIQGNQFPVTPGEEYYVEAWVNGSSGSGGTFRVELQFQDTTITGNAYARIPDVTFTNGRGWVKMTGRIAVPATVNSNPTVKARLYVSFRDVTATSGASVRVANVFLRRANNAELIVDGAISADKIAANAITTAKIQAGAVSADQVAANAITAKHLVITDLQNLIQNGAFASGDAASWSAPAAGYGVRARGSQGSTANVNMPAPFAGYVAAGSGSFRWYPNAGVTIECKEGDEFFFTIDVAISGTVNDTAAQFRPLAVYADGTTANNNNFWTGLSTVWKTFTYVWVAPAGAVGFKPSIQFNANPDGYILFTNFAVRRRNTAELIVNGAIIADKIAANAVTTAKINAGAVTATEIASNAITAVKIAAGAVTADKIAANSVTADKIVANSITSKQLYLTDFSNVFVDYDFVDPAAYTGSSPTITFRGSGTANRGKNEMLINPQSSGQDVSSYSDYYTLETGGNFYAEVSISTDNVAGARGRCEIQIYTVDSSSVYTLTRTIVVSDKTQSTSTSRQGANFDLTGSERVVRVRFRRLGDGTGKVSIGGMMIRRRQSAELIVDGAITADKLSVNSLSAISANFGDAFFSGYARSVNGKMVLDFNNGGIEIFS